MALSNEFHFSDLLYKEEQAPILLYFLELLLFTLTPSKFISIDALYHVQLNSLMAKYHLDLKLLYHSYLYQATLMLPIASNLSFTFLEMSLMLVYGDYFAGRIIFI